MLEQRERARSRVLRSGRRWLPGWMAIETWAQAWMRLQVRCLGQREKGHPLIWYQRVVIAGVLRRKELQWREGHDAGYDASGGGDGLA